VRVSALWIYPVKALRGVRVESARVLAAGFAMDRRWMIVRDSPTGLAFVTQRQIPELVRVRASLEDGAIVLRGPSGGAPLRLPSAPDAPREMVTVWESTLPAVIWREGDGWLARETGLDAHLAFLPPDVTRAVTSSAGHPGDVVSFADAFPYLLTTDASLDDLNQRMPGPITMERFRPNIVVAGARPWEEDEWRSVRVDGVLFDPRKPCARCAVPTVDPETGIKGQEPSRTLATFRTRDGKVLFGVNAVARTEGELHVGDEVILP